MFKRRGGKHEFRDRDYNESRYVNECTFCKKFIPYCSNIRSGKHAFLDRDYNESKYVNKCIFCGGYAPYCSNIRSGKHELANGKCIFCDNKYNKNYFQKYGYNLNKATEYLINATINSNSNDPAYCATFVQNALEKAGFSFNRVGHAYLMIYLLPKLGFSECNYNNCIQNPKNGDIVVEEPAGRHTSGHVQMWCSKIGKWVSYFWQSNRLAIVHSDIQGYKHYFRY